ncbi:PVC-type heme-binding CxxCH protein [Prosthecobacter sp.]|uniref:PVC-type heme-binding CxxCH protein n=1 Tax=Prosthecobacter sp. TaxID=1965333 RepID=UPI002ABAEB1D|nr:PVC-type heme-binding CxxCH protein [Prosthecobacter sp.]MDZ4402908.1 PVC-type heme-binding CxxCH protein [Prosthecobacter sp.]
MKSPIAFLASISLACAADFPALYNSEPGNPSPMSPQEALKALKLPEGFKATLFAAEPDVQNPIGMAWDARGRMWVAENYTYAERAKRFDLGLKDRVIILEDKDWDGVAETRKVFTEDVQMLTSVEVGRGGVWLMCPPRVLFIPDANGDDIPDGEPEVVLDGFTVAKDNYHNFANGLRFGPDGWLYGRCGHSCPGKLGIPGTPDEQRIPMKGGIWRFHPEKKIVEVLTHGTTNPWGHDWDQNGEMFFINTVTGHLWHLIHGAHLMDSNTLNPLVYEKLDTIADHYHYDRSGSWTESRDGKANSLGGGHAHIGMMIYQGDQWPAKYRNKLFTLNMHGRRANVERLERNGSGYVGKHEPDVFLSDDPWFRGIEISTGPDGSGFILDWSDTGECHDSTGIHRTSGRIFRVSYGEPKKPTFDYWAGPLHENLDRLLHDPNVWFERMIRLGMIGSGTEPSWVSTKLRAFLRSDDSSTSAKLRALWMLHSMGELSPSQFLEDKDEHLRVWAIRFLTESWPLDRITGPTSNAFYPDNAEALVAFIKMAKDDKSAFVRLQLASVLQRLPVIKRPLLAKALLSHTEDANDPFLSHMVWFGISPLAKYESVGLVALAKDCQWPKVTRWIARSLATQPEMLNMLLVINRSDEVLEGMSEAFKGLRKAPKPANWDQVIATSKSPLIRDLSILFGDGRALDDVKKIALDDKADIQARESALKTLIEARPDDLRSICTQLLDVRTLNTTAARGLAQFDDPEIGKQLAKSYRKFATSIMDTLVSRPAFAQAMLAEMTVGKIPRSDLTAFHARQIRSFNDESLTKQLTEAWGELRESAADKKQLIEKVKAQLTPDSLAKANLSQGRMLFTAVCGACHVMYGQGGKIGPDLTGSGRSNIDYLLENIADPSGVVSADFRMSLLTHKDGRILSGVIAESNDRTLTLRTVTETLTLDRADITKQETSPMSMMPEGLFLALQPDMVRDLIAYLMHPVQVSMPK